MTSAHLVSTVPRQTRFEKGAGTVTFECWPRSADVTQPGAEQFPGWPRTITP